MTATDPRADIQDWATDFDIRDLTGRLEMGEGVVPSVTN